MTGRSARRRRAARAELARSLEDASATLVAADLPGMLAGLVDAVAGTHPVMVCKRGQAMIRLLYLLVVLGLALGLAGSTFIPTGNVVVNTIEEVRP